MCSVHAYYIIVMCFLAEGSSALDSVIICHYYGALENIAQFGWIRSLGGSDSFALDHKCVIEVDTLSVLSMLCPRRILLFAVTCQIPWLILVVPRTSPVDNAAPTS